MDVLFVSKYCVQDHLKSPSTAEFPYNSNHVYHVDSNRYVVNSYVDSQNSFGAMIRTRFVCTVFMKDKDSGVCHDVKFIE